MHLLQEHFPALAAVSGNMVARWAHANEVPARPRRGLLHFVTPDTDAGRYIIELAMSARDTWEEMRALLVVRRRALCARSATKCMLTPHAPVLPLSLPLARARSLSLSRNIANAHSAGTLPGSGRRVGRHGAKVGTRERRAGATVERSSSRRRAGYS